MKILLTGGGGFIGSYLANHLSNNYEVFCLDHGRQYSILKKNIRKNVCFVKGDIRDSSILNRLMKNNFEYVIHLAGVLGNSACMEDPVSAVLTHVYGTQLLIQKSIEYNVKRFIFSSTYATYSTFKSRKNPLSEDMVLEPDDLYGALKTMAEKQIQDSKLEYAILRLSNIYGFNPFRRQKGSAIENFIDASVRNSDILIYGSGKQKIDYLNIKDLAECFELLLNNTRLHNEIFNVGSGQLNSIEKIASTVAKYGKDHGSSSKIIKIPAPQGKIWPDKLMSISKVKLKLGWKPKISINEGIREMMENR